MPVKLETLKRIIKQIPFGTEKSLPAMPGYAINDLIQRYRIPAVEWGYFGSYIGIRTKKQTMVWKDQGHQLVFTGIINNDGTPVP